MQRTDKASVIWVGPRGSEAFLRLEAELTRKGLHLAVCESASDLSVSLKSRPRAVLVVPDCHECADLADTALEALESLYRQVPVVVLAEAPAFGRYYDLMRRGVRHYYQLSEPTERIASAVQFTAAHAA